MQMPPYTKEKYIKRKTGLVIRFTWLPVFILLLFTVLCFAAYSEHESWDCRGCGMTGNTWNYYGGCAHPASWIKTDNDEYIGFTQEFRTVGYIVTFGTYPQTAAGMDKTPIGWIVLNYDEERHKALLLSRYGLDTKPDNYETENTMYFLRSYLFGRDENTIISQACAVQCRIPHSINCPKHSACYISNISSIRLL